MDPKPSSSFPILAISILGILTTAILLLSYYLFVTNCCLNWRRLLLLRRLPSSHRRHFHRPQFNLTEPLRGLHPSTINSIPTFRFAKAAAATTPISLECAVCLADFRENELLRVLPNCYHSFHIDCIDIWFQFNPNCPLCRNDISLIQPVQGKQFTGPDQQQDVVIDVITTIDQNATTPTPRPTPKGRIRLASMGDECIDMRKKDERFEVQPIRRSFSMDSSSDRQLYVSVQEILRQNPNLFCDARSNGEGSSGGGGSNGSGRMRRSFFSFGRSSRNAASVLPV